MEELYPGISINIVSYIIGQDSLKATYTGDILSKPSEDIRLRMDGLFEKEEHALQFTKEFIALYTNGPAGGGGIRYFLCLHFLKFPSGSFTVFSLYWLKTDSFTLKLGS